MRFECNNYNKIDINNSSDIEFTGETSIKSNAVIEDGQIRIWNYKTGKVEYYDVNEKAIEKISRLLKDEVNSSNE